VAVFASITYVHVMWIPFVPKEKNLQCVCTACGLVYPERHYSREMVTAAKELKKGLKYSPVHYIGLLLLVVPVAGTLISRWIRGEG
jgi:hypothetical protein